MHSPICFKVASFQGGSKKKKVIHAESIPYQKNKIIVIKHALKNKTRAITTRVVKHTKMSKAY